MEFISRVSERVSASLDVKENDNTSDVINHTLFLSPSFEGGSYQIFSCSLSILL